MSPVGIVMLVFVLVLWGVVIYVFRASRQPEGIADSDCEEGPALPRAVALPRPLTAIGVFWAVFGALCAFSIVASVFLAFFRFVNSAL